MSNYLLICGDGESLESKLVPAFKITVNRLNNNTWPIYPGTKHKNSIQQGDICFFYCAGKQHNAQCIAGVATVDQVLASNRLNVEPDLLSDVPVKSLTFSNIELIDPCSIRDLINNLDLTKHLTRWGSALQGGCRVLSEHDASLLRNLINRNLND